MKAPKHSQEWFDNKWKQITKMQTGYSKVLTATQGYKANGENKKIQRMKSLIAFAKEKGIKIKM